MTESTSRGDMTLKNNLSEIFQCCSPQGNIDSWDTEFHARKFSGTDIEICEPSKSFSNLGVDLDLREGAVSAVSSNPGTGSLISNGTSSASYMSPAKATVLRDGALSATSMKSRLIEVKREGTESTRTLSPGLAPDRNNFTSLYVPGTDDFVSSNSCNSGVVDLGGNDVHVIQNSQNSRQATVSSLSNLSARSWSAGRLSVSMPDDYCNSGKAKKSSIDLGISALRVSKEIPRITGRRQAPWQQVKSNGLKKLQLLKLTFFAAVPALIVIGQSIANLVEDIQMLGSMNTLKDNVQLSLEVAKVIHHIQIERGTSALFVTSGGDQDVKQRLTVLYKNTDDSVDALSNLVAIFENLKQVHSKASLQEYIKGFRSSLEPSTVTLKDVIDFYTDINTALSTTIGMIINVEVPFTYWTELTAFQLLLLGKEQAGIERALGSTYYARGQLPLSDLLWYYEKMTLGVQFLSQSVQFSAYTGSLIDTLFHQTQLAAQISEMRDEIKRNTPISPTVFAGTVWFDNLTEYINILKYVQDELAAKIVKLFFTFLQDPSRWKIAHVCSVNKKKDTQDVINQIHVSLLSNQVLEKDYSQYADNESNKLEGRLIASALQLCVVVVMMPIIVYLLKNIANITNTLGKRTNELSEEKWQTETLLIELEDERRRTEELLYELLPKSVALKLIQSGSALPETFSSVTIMFSDVVDFTEISSLITPMQVVDMLNKLYRIIDGRIENFDVYKVETIGDGYMVASGLPTRNGNKHVEEIAKLALDLLDSLQDITILDFLDQNIRLRIGFHTGPCAAGVVGIKMPRYCIFGDTVNTASRMESTSLPMRIQMTKSSAMVLQKKKEFQIKERGKIEVKGKGQMRTFWLEGIGAR